MKPKGIVYFVGAGPGDPGLITQHGVDRLGTADIILYDYLVNPTILEHASPTAEQICLGRHGRSTIWSQSTINERLVKEATSGKTVVRLKGGDPMVFGRATEEIGAVADAGIPFEIVPGITAALAGAGYSGLPITDRQHASAVAFITGQETPSKTNSSIDYDALIRFPGTLVFYMGITTSRYWTGRLIEAGMSPSTPVTLIRRCSWPDQRTIRCQLQEVADRVTPYEKFPPPAIAIVGDVNHQSIHSWYENKPLFGLSVLVTRPRHQATKMARDLRNLGAEVLLQPAIEIHDPKDWKLVDESIDQLADYNWVLFSSSNAVHRFMLRILERGLDARAFGCAKIGAVGASTTDALSEYHLMADLCPSDSYRADSLLQTLLPNADGERFLVPRASRATESLVDQLRSGGARVDPVTVYRHQDVEHASPEILKRLAAGQVDWVTATSSASVRSLSRLFGDSLRDVKIATISSLTSAAVENEGLHVAAEASQATTTGIIEAILSTLQR